MLSLSRQAAPYLAFAPQNGLKHYLKMQYADQTFHGLYHWNWFDAALLLPYFVVMIVLALYGIHRYTLCYSTSSTARTTTPIRPGTSTSSPASPSNCPSSTSSSSSTA